MKQYFFKIAPAFVLVLGLGFGSCMDKKGDDTKETADKQNDAKFDNSKTEKDADFLVNAAAISREEISLGQLAQQKGNTDHVKELGKMMEEDHSRALQEVTALAKTKNITLPTAQTADGIEAYKKLQDKSGNDFGKAYSDKMVNGHKDAISMFEKAATDANDPDIRQWAQATLTTLRTHLDHAVACQKECEKM